MDKNPEQNYKTQDELDREAYDRPFIPDKTRTQIEEEAAKRPKPNVATRIWNSIVDALKHCR